MVKVLEQTQEAYNPRVVRVSLYADTKEELTFGNTADGIVGIADGTTLAVGSDCFTSEKDLMMLDSNGDWV